MNVRSTVRKIIEETFREHGFSSILPDLGNKNSGEMMLMLGEMGHRAYYGDGKDNESVLWCVTEATARVVKTACGINPYEETELYELWSLVTTALTSYRMLPRTYDVARSVLSLARELAENQAFDRYGYKNENHFYEELVTMAEKALIGLARHQEKKT